jgi:ubiquinone/menaquinone biosynthesis C-methylase UbiE
VADQVHHPIFARVYDRLEGKKEDSGELEFRLELVDGAAGRVIEVGAGNGANFPLYPETVTKVLAVEPEDYLRERATQAAKNASVPVEVVDGLGDQLPVEDGSFDVGVVSLVLCSVPDQAAALAELRRVIRPGGELRFYEHVLATQPGFARAQRIGQPLWSLLAGGCHPDRDTASAIEAAGFEIETCRRFLFRPSLVMHLAGPKILGRARRP